MLEQDLQGLGCAGLLQRPWNIKNKDFVCNFVMIRESRQTKQHFRLHHAGPTGRLDSRSLEGHLLVSTRRKWYGQPDGQVHGG